MKVNTLLIKKNKADNFGFIVIRIKFDDGSQKTISIGEKIPVKDWDNKKKEIRPYNPDHNRINRSIRTHINEIYQQEDFCYKNDIPFSKDFFKKEKDFYTLNGFIREKLKNQQNIGQSTYKIYQSLLNNLNSFDKAIPLKDINRIFAEKYFNYLKKKEIGTTAIKNNFRFIKIYLNLLLDDKLIQYDQYRAIKKFVSGIKIETPNKAFLNIEEINIIKNTSFDDDFFTKEIFLLSFYLGMRVSDIYTLKWEDIRVNNGVIHKKQVKTKENVIIPLKLLFGDTGIEILNHFQGKDSIYIIPRNDCFQKWYSKYINNLKKFIKKTGIQKNVTPHTARHSCATYLVEKYNIKVAQAILGHTDIKTTERYYHLSEGSVINMIESAQKHLKVV